MIILLLLSIPLLGILLVSTSGMFFRDAVAPQFITLSDCSDKRLKSIALKTSVCALLVSLVLFAFFDLSNNQFQFVQEYHEISYFSFYLGLDGLSIYFVLLTTIIMPISLLSN